MKKCPYCAEMIQDEAIKCRYCYSDLTVATEQALSQRPSGAGDDGAETATSGRSEPSTSSTPERPSGQPATPEPAVAVPVSSSQPSGGQEAVRYTHSGYRYVLGYGTDFFGIWDRRTPTVAAERFPRTDDGWRQAWLRFQSLEPNSQPVPSDEAPAAATSPGSRDALQYTHSGSRYLLGYGADFFGIWDRQDPAAPVETFPRSDDGWADAWRRYVQIESNYTEVTIGDASA